MNLLKTIFEKAEQLVVPKNVFTETPVKEKSVNEIIEQIHAEFNNAGDELLREANEILKNTISTNEKASILNELGFTATKEVKDMKETTKKRELSEKTIKLISEYQIKYPNYKFITEDMVNSICEKYSLICGDISSYTGFVPLKNLNQIKDFKEKYPFNIWSYSIWHVHLAANERDDSVYHIDMSNYVIGKSSYGCYYHFYHKNRNDNKAFQSNDGITFYGDGEIDGKKYNLRNMRKVSMKICAPLKDMELKNRQKVSGNFIVEIPDPVVLQPVEGGYLIVTAWGDESSDELVVNHKFN